MPWIKDKVTDRDQSIGSWDLVRARIVRRELTDQYIVRDNQRSVWFSLLEHPETRDAFAAAWGVPLPAATENPETDDGAVQKAAPTPEVPAEPPAPPASPRPEQIREVVAPVVPPKAEVSAPIVEPPKPPPAAARPPEPKPIPAAPVRPAPVTPTNPIETTRPQKTPSGGGAGAFWAVAIAAGFGIYFFQNQDQSETAAPEEAAVEEPAPSEPFAAPAATEPQSFDPNTPAIMQTSATCPPLRIRQSPSSNTPALLGPDGEPYILAPGSGVKARGRLTDLETGAQRTWVEITWPVAGYIADSGFDQCDYGFLTTASEAMVTAIVSGSVSVEPVDAGFQLRVTEYGARVRVLPTTQDALGQQIMDSGPLWNASGMLRPDTILTPTGKVTGLRGEVLEGIWYRIDFPVAGYVSGTTVDVISAPFPAGPTPINFFTAPTYLSSSDLSQWQSLNMTEYRNLSNSDNFIARSMTVRAIPAPYGRSLGEITTDQLARTGAINVARVDGEYSCELAAPWQGFLSCEPNSKVAQPAPRSDRTTSTPSPPARAPSRPVLVSPTNAPPAVKVVSLGNSDFAKIPDEKDVTQIVSRYVPDRHMDKRIEATLRCTVGYTGKLNNCRVFKIQSDLKGFRKSAEAIGEEFVLTSTAQNRVGTAESEIYLDIDLVRD